MILKAILSNKAHPEFGQATVPFPIPDSEYDNSMKLEQIYDGRHFPEYHYEPCVASVTLSRPGQDGRETLYLPCPDIKIARALQRLDEKSVSQCTAVLDTGDICNAVRKVFEEEFNLNEHLEALNRLGQCQIDEEGGEFGTYGTIKYIIGEGISGHFAGHITLADLNSESGIQKINQLAKIEIDILSRQCLSQSLSSFELIARQVNAWILHRNAAWSTVHWRFATCDARCKLRKLYPAIL